MVPLGVISAAIPVHPLQPRRKRSAVRRWPGRSMGLPRPPQGKAPLCKGSCHGFAVTEGLSEVDSPFGGDLCSDFHPSLATAAQTLRCAPLTWAIAAALRNHP